MGSLCAKLFKSSEVSWHPPQGMCEACRNEDARVVGGTVMDRALGQQLEECDDCRVPGPGGTNRRWPGDAEAEQEGGHRGGDGGGGRGEARNGAAGMASARGGQHADGVAGDDDQRPPGAHFFLNDSFSNSQKHKNTSISPQKSPPGRQNAQKNPLRSHQVAA